jgi:NAD(P)-dependent dehydrogenase (short-subunit alcohol dehydrogenase family)
MASNPSGKIAFVTGGASGIGAALTTELVDKGAEVWIADRQVGAAGELAQRLNSGGGKAHVIELDVRSYPSFERAVAEAVQQSGGSTICSTMPALGSAARSSHTRLMTGTTSST